MKHIFMLHDVKSHHDLEGKIKEIMKEYDYEIVYNASIINARNYIKQLTQKSRIYIVGGDGTLNVLIQVLVNTDHEVVVLPFGTGNDFNRTLTSYKDPLQILKKSLTCLSEKVDTIKLNDIYYINSACFGIDEIIASTVHETSSLLLKESYISSILRNVFQYKGKYVSIYDQDNLLYEGKMTLCTVNNGKYYGGGFPIIPHADIQDGMMDICVVDEISKVKYPYMISLLLEKRLQKRKEVHYFKTKELKIEIKGDCNVDGERYKSEEYIFSIQPLSVNIVWMRD